MKAAIIQLEIHLKILEKNGSVNRAERRVEQADQQARNASEIRYALEVLRAVEEGKPKPQADETVTIQKLWDSMPPDMQRKISLYDLKRLVDTYNTPTVGADEQRTGGKQCAASVGASEATLREAMDHIFAASDQKHRVLKTLALDPKCVERSYMAGEVYGMQRAWGILHELLSEPEPDLERANG